MCMLMLTACEARIQPVAEQETHSVGASAQASTKGHYAKPGAEVRFANPAPIALEPNKAGEFDVVLVTVADQGVMHVHITVDPELELLSGSTQAEFTLTPGGSYSLPLQLLSQTPGRFYMRFQVSIETEGQVKGRSLTLAVQSGAPVAPSEKAPREKMAPSSSGAVDDVISLPAQETITIPDQAP